MMIDLPKKGGTGSLSALPIAFFHGLGSGELTIAVWLGTGGTRYGVSQGTSPIGCATSIARHG